MGADRGGFTLVEMLVVIVIITILAAISIPVVFGVIAKAKDQTINADIQNIARGIEAYKVEMGSYPPDFSTFSAMNADQKLAVINQHLRAKFPYRNIQTDIPPGLNLLNAQPNWNAKIADLNHPAEAIYFWLRGFTPDPQRPLAGPQPSATEVQRNNFFDLDPTQLQDADNDGWPEFAAKNGRGKPFVYFNSDTYKLAAQNASLEVHPYMRPGAMDDNNVVQDEYILPKKFQIISAGQDGDWGTGDISQRFFPQGNTFIKTARDNISNFSNGSRFGDVE